MESLGRKEDLLGSEALADSIKGVVSADAVGSIQNGLQRRMKEKWLLAQRREGAKCRKNGGQ